MRVWLVDPAKLTSMLTMQHCLSTDGTSMMMKQPGFLAPARFTYHCVIAVSLRILK